MNKELRKVLQADVDARLKEFGAFARSYPAWTKFYKAVRLKCLDCGATMIYHRDNAKHKVYAFCQHECGFTMQATEYRYHKGMVVLALVTRQPTTGLWPWYEEDHEQRVRTEQERES